MIQERTAKKEVARLQRADCRTVAASITVRMLFHRFYSDKTGDGIHEAAVARVSDVNDCSFPISSGCCNVRTASCRR